MTRIIKKNSLRVNIASNFIGSIWTTILVIIFVPFYLRYIGIEAYGLIGVFTGIQAFIALLDFGLSPTLNRELARLSAFDDQAQAMHDIKRTLEIPNWISAAVITVGLCALSPLIAKYWVRPVDLTESTITQSLWLMSISVAVQFLSSFYVGGVLGMQRQLYLNAVNIISSTLRSAGGFLVLVFISPTIQAFLIWQCFVAVFQLFSVWLLLKKSLPASPLKGRFQRELLKKIWRFAAGMTGLTILSLVLIQTDKLILSRMLSLQYFGYYALAITISGMAVGTIVSSITNSVYPKYSHFVFVKDEAGLSDIYHRSCQVLSAVLIPVVLVIAAFSYQILQVWTGDEKISANTYLLLTITAIGTGLNGIMYLPYHLQLAHGWTRLSLYINVAAIIILVPVMIAGVYKYGAVGGATVYAALNFSYIFITIQLMHRRILKDEKWKWYIQDLLFPLAASALIVMTGRYFLNDEWVSLIKVLYIGGILGLAFVAAIAVLPQLRSFILAPVFNARLAKQS